MKRIIQNRVFLQKCKNKKNCKHLVKHASSDELRSICECAKNILKGHVRLNQGTVTKLRPFKKHLHKLSLKKVSLKTKRKILQQGSGFFLPLLGSIATSELTSVFNNGS
jgi:hypothetical protein